MKAHKMPVLSFAGSGNAGTFLALQLFKAGCFINQIYSRTLANAKLLSAKVSAEAIDDVNKIDNNIDLLIIALPDNVIPGFCENLSKTGKFKELKIASVSGSVRLSEFSSYFQHSGVLYPLQSFTRKTNPVSREIPLCIEATDEQTQSIIKQVSEYISDDIRYLDSKQRMQLHMAAVFASNFTNHMIALADDILSHAGIQRDILLPLIHETINRLDTHRAIDMQTGPAVRNDFNTINKHIDLLDKFGDERLTGIYKLISENIYFTGQKKHQD